METAGGRARLSCPRRPAGVQRTWQSHTYPPEPSGLARAPPQLADQCRHGRDRPPLIVRIHVGFAALQDLPHQIDQSRLDAPPAQG
jgi:hypothetical protein